MFKKKKKPHLYLDTVSMSVKKVKIGVKERILKMMGYVLVAALFFGLALLFAFYFLDSPKTERLERELYKTEIQYKYLNKRLNQLTVVLEDLQQRDQNLYRIIFEAEPPTDRKKLSNDYSRFSDYSMGELITETSSKTDALASALYAQSMSLDEVYDMAVTKSERLECMPAIIPIDKKKGRVISGFGMRYHPIFKKLRPHTGIDIVAQRGTPIYATGNGVVEAAGNSLAGFSGYGVCCVLNHGFGYKSLYAHMDKLAIRRGQKVKRGDILGYVGSTGYATGSHLHYEVFVNGRQVDPVYYFFVDVSPEEYLEILNKSKEINQSLS